MRRQALTLAGLTALTLVLAACEGEKRTAQKGAAEGEILPGSASDAMLPYDTVRSQPPLAPLPTASGKADGKASGGAKEDETAAAADEETADAGPAAAAPAEAPSPAAQ